MSTSSLSPPTTPDSASSAPASPDLLIEDDSSEIDELDHRSRKLTQLLRKNADKADTRSDLLNVVKKRAWLLSDHVNQLEEQTTRTRRALTRNSVKRRLIMFGAFMSSVILIGLGFNHIASSDKE